MALLTRKKSVDMVQPSASVQAGQMMRRMRLGYARSLYKLQSWASLSYWTSQPKASVPFMVTKQMREQLQELGYRGKEVKQMDAAVATEIIKEQRKAPVREAPKPKEEESGPTIHL